MVPESYQYIKYQSQITQLLSLFVLKSVTIRRFY